jgi:hypothetical protein
MIAAYKVYIIIRRIGSDLKASNTYIICLSTQLVDHENEEGQEELTTSVPVCGANLSTPVIDRAYYINEIQYRIGDRLYIENAD